MMKARMKRAASWLLCGCMLFACLPGAQANVGTLFDNVPTIPGYTHYTASTLDTSLKYLIVTKDSDDNVYALYASKTGASVGSGSLSSDMGSACAAKLDISGDTPSASYLRDSSTLELSALQFTAAEFGQGYTLSSNGYYLALGDKMFDAQSAELTATGFNGEFQITSPSSKRVLNFNRVGDSASRYPEAKYITDFWGPTDAYNFPIYLYVEGDWTDPNPGEQPGHAGGAPAPGTTEGQPFASGTAGSTNFRIPSLVTLPDGTLLAAADARWNHEGDACALDTIISYSKDNGETWNYSFANYFNDSTDAKNAHATAFIDPVMTVGNDGTVYLLVDLFPGGVALNTAPTAPDAATGYVEINGELRLALYTRTSGQTDDNYAYYVGDFDNGYAPVYAKGDDSNAFCYVDEHYYLYNAEKEAVYCPQLGSSDVVQQNVFFYNAELHVRNATYLWLVKSSDGGETWSSPTILNPQIRKTASTDQFYGVGPGAGLCLEDGTIVLPCYTFTSGGPGSSGQVASFIYSSDGGVTWKRSDDSTTYSHWSSESALVQIDATTLRHFYRDGYATLYYTDHTWDAGLQKWVAGSPVDTGVSKTNNNQLSAIKYSKTIDGKTAILLSTADGGGNSRSNGKIYTFTLKDDKTMELAYTYSVTSGAYGYSSLTELADGSIGLLYEVGATIGYHHYPIEDIVDGAVIEGKPKLILNAAETELTAGTTTTLTAQIFNAEGIDPVWSSDNDSVVTLTGSGESVTAAALTPGKATITAELTVEGRVYSGSIKLYVSDGETVTLPDDFEDAATLIGEGYLLDSEGPHSGGTYAIVWLGNDDQSPRVLYHTGAGDTDQVMVSISGPLVTLNSGFPTSRQLWEIQEVGDSYSLQSADSNRYLDIIGGTSSKLKTSQSAVPLLITPIENGMYTIGANVNGTMYYVHHADSNVQFNADTEATPLALYQYSSSLYTISVSGLSSLIAKIENESLSQYNYTSDTWAAFADAMSAAERIAAGGVSTATSESAANAKLGEVTSAAQALYASRRGLVQAPYIGSSNGTGKVDKVTTTNPDGSVTTTVTDKRTGTVTETTKLTDGTVKVVETKKDGSINASEKRPDGTQGATTVSADGAVSAEVTLSSIAVKAAAESGEAVTLPVTGITASVNGIATVKVSLPETAKAVKVEVPVEKATSGTVLILVRDDGSEELMKATALTENGVAAALDGSATLKVVDNSKSFSDVAAVEGWAGDAITFVTARGFFGGTGGGRFSPTENMDRAMLVTVLHRLENEPDSGSALDAFADRNAIPGWSAEAMAWGVENGIINGNGNTLQPSAAVSREQLVVILYRYAGSPGYTAAGLDGYADAAQVSAWAQDAMQWAVGQGLLTGKSGSKLDPAGTASRAEVSTILMRFINRK